MQGKSHISLLLGAIIVLCAVARCFGQSCLFGCALQSMTCYQDDSCADYCCNNQCSLNSTNCTAIQESDENCDIHCVEVRSGTNYSSIGVCRGTNCSANGQICVNHTCVSPSTSSPVTPSIQPTPPSTTPSTPASPPSTSTSTTTPIPTPTPTPTPTQPPVTPPSNQPVTFPPPSAPTRIVRLNNCSSLTVNLFLFVVLSVLNLLNLFQ